MLIAIISDIHDNLENLKKAIKYILDASCEELVCCGDVTNDETLEYLVKNFSKPIHLVDGNIELFNTDLIKKFNNLKYYGSLARLEIDNKQVGVCHEPFKIAKLFERGPLDVIFYGHTHKPWQKNQDSTLIVNPGNVAGVLHAPTFATWDTKANELKLHLINEL